MANINLSALSTATTAANALSGLVLVTPSEIKSLKSKNRGYRPQSVDNDEILGRSLLFHYEGENSVMLESDITDHFTEDNTSIVDQIALRPEVVSVTGYIGELNDVVPESLEYEKFAAQKLTTIVAYAPALTLTALQAYNHAVFLYSIGFKAYNASVASLTSLRAENVQATIDGANNGTSLNTLANGSLNNQNKQQIAFQQFYGYWRQRTLFTVQTPWAIFKNMAIKTLRAFQDEATNMVTGFEITFKIMRFSTTKTTRLVNPNTVTSPLTPSVDDVNGHAIAQVTPKENLGQTAGIPGTSITQARAAFNV